MVSCTAIKATANLSHSLNPTNCRVILGRNVFHFMCSKLIQKHSWSNLFCIIRIVLATLSMAPYPSLSERSARLQDSSSQLFEPLQFTDCGSADSFIERLLPSCHRQSHFLSHYQQFLPPLAKETLCHSKAKSTAKQSSLQACAVSQSSLYISFYIFLHGHDMKLQLDRSSARCSGASAAGLRGDCVGDVPAWSTLHPACLPCLLTRWHLISCPACFFTAFSVFLYGLSSSFTLSVSRYLLTSLV